MCYAYVMDPDLALLDELLVRLRVAQLRPSWRRQLLSGSAGALGLSGIRLLRAVERCSADGELPSIRAVAEELGVEHSTASRAVTAQEQAGMLARTASADDQRRTCLELTDAGRRALDETTERRRAMVAGVVGDWSADELHALTLLLVRLADDFDAGPRA
jgi:DNA-binding MarR family transcriptional regulator